LFETEIFHFRITMTFVIQAAFLGLFKMIRLFSLFQVGIACEVSLFGTDLL